MTNQKLKEFINSFDIKTPTWDHLPKRFPNNNLDGLTQTEIGKFNAIRTLWEFEQPKKTTVKSRSWSSARGYRFLFQWSNAVLLRILIRTFTKTLPKSEHRTKTQLDDAGRSVVSNIEEGYRRSTTKEYLQFLGYSEGSLEEVHGDINKCLQDGFLSSKKGSKLQDLGISLKKWNDWAKNPLHSSNILLFPLEKNSGGHRVLKDVTGKDVTYEMFVELINKTDWGLRRLVTSLETKMGKEKKGYLVEKMRIGGR